MDERPAGRVVRRAPGRPSCGSTSTKSSEAWPRRPAGHRGGGRDRRAGDCPQPARDRLRPSRCSTASARCSPSVWASTCCRTRCASSTRSACSSRVAARRRSEPLSLMYCSRHGQEIWREPRGTAAGYPWPQLSIHRGALQEVLLERVRRPGLGPSTSTSGTDSCEVGADERAGDGHLRAGRGRHAVDGVTVRPWWRPTASTAWPGPSTIPTRAAPQWNGSLLWRGVRRDRAGARRAHDGVGRPSRPEVRGLPDRRAARRPSGLQLHRRAAPTRVGSQPAGGLEPGRRSGRLPARVRGLVLRLARRPGHHPVGTGHVPVPHGRPRPGGALDVRAFDAARRRGPPDVPDRIQRGVAGHPRRPGAGGLPARRPATWWRRSSATSRLGGLPPQPSWRPTGAWGRRCPCSWCTSVRPTGSTTSTRSSPAHEIDEVTMAYRRTAGFALSALQDDPRSLIDQVSVE